MALTLVVEPLPVLQTSANGFLQLVRLTVTADTVVSGAHCAVSYRREGIQEDVDLGELLPGKNRARILLPEATARGEAIVAARYAGETTTAHIAVGPVRRWNVYLALHSHTDLGFTAPVSDVVEIHNRNTDHAVRLCQETLQLGDGERFKWTCEVSWQVQNYVNSRSSEQIEVLMDLVRRGLIEIGGLYAGEHTDIVGHEEAVRSLYYAAELRRRYGVPVDTVLLCDVPGCTAGFVQVMAKAGMRGLVLADNNFLAPFLRRTTLPRPFLWRGADQTSILCWYTDHPFYAYVEGEWYGFADGVDVLLDRLPEKLASLEASGYAFHSLQVQYAFDNAELNERPAGVVREWNRRWAWPRIHLATPREFFSSLRREAREHFPERSGDWTSWWASIATGFPAEAALTRALHDRLPAVEMLLALADAHGRLPAYPAGEISSCYEGLLAFDEHSGGGGVWKPASDQELQRSLQEGYGFIHRAAAGIQALEKTARRSLEEFLSTGPGPASTAHVNTLGWARAHPSGGADTPSRNRGMSVPPYGYLLTTDRIEKNVRAHQHVPGESPHRYTVLENERVRITIDRLGARITSVYSKELSCELQAEGGHGWGEPIIFLTKPVKEIELGRYIPELYDGTPAAGEIVDLRERTVVHCSSDNEEPQCVFHYSTNGVPWLTRRVSLDDEGGIVFMETVLHRRVIADPALRAAFADWQTPNALLYLEFRFALDAPALHYESPNGIQHPPTMQLPGACHDFYAVQHWLLLSSARSAVTLVAQDSPLMDFGSPGFQQYRTRLDENLANIYVRAASFGEWGTNRESPYSQGDLSWRFALNAWPRAADLTEDIERACRFGWEHHNPLWEIPLSGGGELPEGRFLSIEPSNIQALSFKKAEDGPGYVLRLQEMTGRPTEATISFPGLRIQRAQSAMITEEPLENLPIEGNAIALSFRPQAIHTLRIQFQTPENP